MADAGVALQEGRSLRRSRLTWIAAAVVIVAAGIGIWAWRSAGRETTDDAQVDGHITQIAAKVGGVILKVDVKENQPVKAGAVLVQIDPRDYQVAVDRAAAELADAEAMAQVADVDVPIASTTTASDVSGARAEVEQAGGGVAVAEREVEAARARLASAQARLRERQADAMKASRDVERFKGLIAKDEVPRQQFESAEAADASARAAVEAAQAAIAEAETGVKVAESRLIQARGSASHAGAMLRSAETAPQQLTATRARAAAAAARVQQAKAALEQAKLNLEYTTIKAPTDGIVSKKTIEVGQVVQAGQPLLAIVSLQDLWVTANFKETQLEHIRPGQPATVTVDALGKREFRGHVDSIAAATGARFSLLPPENASGNYVKVVQRVPVKIVLEPGQDPEGQLRPGMSAFPTVFTR